MCFINDLYILPLIFTHDNIYYQAASVILTFLIQRYNDVNLPIPG